MIGAYFVIEPALELRRDGQLYEARLRDSHARRDRAIDDWRRLAAEAEEVEDELKTLFTRRQAAGAIDGDADDSGVVDTIDRITGFATSNALAPVQVRRIDHGGPVRSRIEENEFEVHAEGRFRDVLAFLTEAATSEPSLALVAFSIRSAGARLVLNARFSSVRLRDPGTSRRT